MSVTNNKKLLPEIIEKNSKQAYGYIRVSDDMQIEGASLITQTRAIEQFCKDNNLELIEVYSDPGKTGLKVNNRPGFLKLLETIQPHNWLILFELSRFARDQLDSLSIFRDLVRNKYCTFICINPSIDSRSENCDLMFGIYSTVVQNESKTISTRVKANMSRLSKEGKLMCRPPFGYVQDPATRHYVKDEEQQEILEQLRVWYLTGVNVNEMTRRLNEEGKGYVLNNNKKKKIENPKFSAATISNILRGYGIIKDDKTPKYTYYERIENWNATLHKPKVLHTTSLIADE